MNTTTKGKQLAGIIMGYSDNQNQAQVTAHIAEYTRHYDKETLQITIEELEDQNYNNEAEELYSAIKTKRSN